MKRITLILLSFIIIYPAIAQDLHTVIKKNNEAMGLPNRLKINHLETNGNATMSGTDAKIPFKIIQSKPDLLRIETTLFGFKTIQTYDGTSAWTLSPTQGNQAIKSDARDMEFMAAATAIEGPFSVNKHNKYTLSYDGEKEYLGKNTHLLLWSSPEERLKYYINENNWLVDGVRYEYKKNGGWYSMEYRIKSYKDFEGSKFPDEITTVINGIEMITLIVKEIKVLAKINKEEFGRPSL